MGVRQLAMERDIAKATLCIRDACIAIWLILLKLKSMP
jgi:hypothetical protein